MNDPALLRQRLKECPAGRDGWRDFEEACVDTLEYLFVPPLIKPRPQSSDLSKLVRRDAILANRMTDLDTNWGRLYHEHAARMILFEFKNYDLKDISGEEVYQVSRYMEKHFGKLAIICCNKSPLLMVAPRGKISLSRTRSSSCLSRWSTYWR